MLNLMPVCFYPTTVIAVDDDQNLLDFVKLAVSGDFNCIAFSNPREALDYCVKYDRNQSSFTDLCISSEKNPTTEAPNTTIKLKRIHKQIYNAKRFDEVSVILIDFSMPGMSGLELCKKITHLPCVTIMLTGEADESTAIEAFNKGLIDGFYRKSDATTTEKLLGLIQTKAFAYFQKRSTLISKNLLKAPGCYPACLGDSAFTPYLQKLMLEQDIMEYYLFNDDGYFLLVHGDGSLSWLVVKNDEEMDALAGFIEDIHQQEPDEISEKLLNSLKKRTEIIFAATADQTNRDIEEWPAFCYPLETVVLGSSSYYVALIKDEKTLKDLDQNFTHFME